MKDYILRNRIVNNKKYLKRNTKSYNRNKFINVFMKKPIFYSYILFIGIFVFLDYSVYTEVFHFSDASFIENYFYNIDIFSSGFLIVFIALPIIVIMSFFLALYLFISEINKKKDKIYSSKLEYFTLIFLLLSFLNLIGYSILDKCNLLINGYSILIYIFIIMICELLLLKLYISLDFKYFSKYNKLYKYILFIVLYFLVYFLVFSYYYNYNIFYLYFILFYFTFIGLLVSYLNYKVTKKTRITKVDKLAFLISFIIILPSIFYWLNNTLIWNNLNSFSYNLVLNNGFKSQNYHNIKVNVLGYENNISKYCLCQNKNDLYVDIKADTNTTYIPFFKNQKIYFVKNDKNLTCVYIVKEKDDKFLLNDIGYLDGS